MEATPLTGSHRSSVSEQQTLHSRVVSNCLRCFSPHSELLQFFYVHLSSINRTDAIICVVILTKQEKNPGHKYVNHDHSGECTLEKDCLR